MRRVLITGGAGFIGLHLAKRLLNDGCRVDLWDDFSRGRHDSEIDALVHNKMVTLIEGSLADPDVAKAVDQHYSEIFHLAAILGVQTVADRPFDVLAANTTLTLAAIEVARRQRDLRRLVYASTSEVYAGTLESFELPFPTPENAPLALSPLERPRTSYMLSKIYGEALCLHSGMPVTIVRPHNVYGPRMGLAHVIPQLMQRAIAAPDDGDIQVYSSNHSRTFCYVDDAVEMISRLATAPAASGLAVNVGTQEPEITIRQLAEVILRVLGKRLTLLPGPPTPGSPPRRAPDMSRCTGMTGYRSRVGIEDGVQRTWAWYRQSGLFAQTMFTK